MIHIFDANNWVRRQLETNLRTSLLRFCFNEIQNVAGTPIVVWDGMNSRKIRKDKYPLYKEGRQKASDDIYKSMDLLKQLLELSRAMQIEVPGYEADDVIAKLAPKCAPAVHVHTTDQDIAALGVTIDRNRPLPCPPNELRLYKALVGDSSDNVKGIPGFGEKAWAKLTTEDKSDLTQLLKGDLSEGVLDDNPADAWNMGNAQYEWLKANLDQARIMWEIVGFYDVPDELINQHTKPGLNNPEAANRLMQEYRL